jgi:medium-chain acyl-[acyl-carrier-protein] hydrolase
VSSLPPTPWLRLFPKPSARLRLICFPFAGGGGSLFAPWQKLAPDWVEIGAVLLPGRESRFREPPLWRLTDLILQLAEGLAPAFDGRYAFYGHSLGALIAFELARHLRNRGQRVPEALCVGGCGAPHRLVSFGRISGLPEEQFIAELRQLHGIPREVLENRELLQLVLPTLRADISMRETYTFSLSSPLTSQILAYSGWGDPRVSESDLHAWSIYSVKPLKVTLVPGDHFFITTAQAPFLQALWSDLAAVTSPG